MPNRMLRDWTKSKKMKQVDPLAERFFTRLIMKVDDHGCLYADTTLLKADLFPFLLDTVREADISRWLAACQKAGLILLYERQGEKLLQIIDFRQRLDKARSKFPLPDYNDFPELVNEFPAELETETEVEKEKERGAPAAPRPPDPVSKEKKTRQKFLPPTHQQLQEYFIKKIGEKWGEDKCRLQASMCFDHYSANGWVQNKGKPIVDWPATARNWMRREMTGEFSSQSNFKPVDEKQSSPRPFSPPPAPKPSVPIISQEQKMDDSRSFVEDLYRDYLAGALRQEFVSTAAYDILKTEGLMKMGASAVQHIRERAMNKRMTELRNSDSPADKKLASSLVEFPDNWKADTVFPRYAKIFSLLHFFEQLKSKNIKKVFCEQAV